MSQSSIAPDPPQLLRAKHLRPGLVPPSSLQALGDAVGLRHRAFSQHIALEEGRCGFFAFLVMAAPRYLSMVEHLRSDHQELGRALAALRIKIIRAAPEQLEALLAESDAIADAIAEHDELEREMLRDALETV